MTLTKQYDCIIATMPLDEGLSTRQIINVVNKLDQEKDYIIFDTAQIDSDIIHNNEFIATVFASVPLLDTFDYNEKEFVELILKQYDFSNVDPQEITLNLGNETSYVLVIWQQKHEKDIKPMTSLNEKWHYLKNQYLFF